MPNPTLDRRPDTCTVAVYRAGEHPNQLDKVATLTDAEVRVERLEAHGRPYFGGSVVVRGAANLQAVRRVFLGVGLETWRPTWIVWGETFIGVRSGHYGRSLRSGHYGGSLELDKFEIVCSQVVYVATHAADFPFVRVVEPSPPVPVDGWWTAEVERALEHARAEAVHGG